MLGCIDCWTLDVVGCSWDALGSNMIHPNANQHIPKISKKIQKIPKISKNYPNNPKISLLLPKFPNHSQTMPNMPLLVCLRLRGLSGGPERITTELIQKYAKSVKSPGFYMEVADAELFVQRAGGTLAVAVDNAYEPLTIQHSLAQWSEALKEQGFPCLDIQDIDPSDPHCWLILSVNASYDPRGRKNHWMPAFFKQQVTDSEYFDMTVLAASELVKSIREKKKELSELQSTIQEKSEMNLMSEEEAALSAAHVAELELEIGQLLCLVAHSSSMFAGF